MIERKTESQFNFFKFFWESIFLMKEAVTEVPSKRIEKYIKGIKLIKG
jgi:hypothetical protein